MGASTLMSGLMATEKAMSGALPRPHPICPRLLRASCECRELSRLSFQKRASRTCVAYRDVQNFARDTEHLPQNIEVKLPLSSQGIRSAADTAVDPRCNRLSMGAGVRHAGWMTNARVVVGSATALVLTALLGFQAGTIVPLSSRTVSFLSVGRHR